MVVSIEVLKLLRWVFRSVGCGRLLWEGEEGGGGERRVGEMEWDEWVIGRWRG